MSFFATLVLAIPASTGASLVQHAPSFLQARVSNAGPGDWLKEMTDSAKRALHMDPVEPLAPGRLTLACASGPDLYLGNLVHSNLAGKGPDAGDAEMRFANVATQEGKAVDLVVTSQPNYRPGNISRNGLHGACGQINLNTNSTAELTFSFQYTETKQPVALSNFFFTVLDVDGSKEMMTWEKFSLETETGYEYFTSLNTKILSGTWDSGKLLTFGATTWGTEADNPLDPTKLTQEQMDIAVAFFFESPTESFNLRYWGRAKYDPLTMPEWSQYGRNMLFAGKTPLTCP